MPTAVRMAKRFLTSSWSSAGRSVATNMAGGKTKALLREVNLEAGKPLVDQAIKRLTFELSHSRALGCTVLKIIHGYGSSGTGGRISDGKPEISVPITGTGKDPGFHPRGRLFPLPGVHPPGLFFDAENSARP